MSADPAVEGTIPDWLEPWRVDGWKARRTACPSCKAPPGERCHTTGGRSRNNHPERNFAASIAAYHADPRREDDRPQVRMGMTGADALLLRGWLARQDRSHPAVGRVRGQLWLLGVLVEQRAKTAIAERAAFTERADRMLEALDA